MWLAAVGPGMFRLTGHTADGVHIHPFHTRTYLEQVAFPALYEGTTAAGRKRGEVARSSVLFVVTGRDEAEMAAAAQRVKQRIAFYASTPSYRMVLEASGWDVGPRLTGLSRRGAWAEMGELIDDGMLREIAVVAEPENLGAAISARCAGLLDRVGLDFGDFELGDDEMGSLLAELGAL